MSYEDILKLALPPVITFLVAIFLPETLRLDIRSILSYLVYEKWKFRSYLLRCRQMPGHKFGLAGFYQIDSEGRLLASGPGITLTRDIIEQLRLVLRGHSTSKDFAKQWPIFTLTALNVKLPQYARYIKRITGVRGYMARKDGVNDTFHLIIWGTVTEGKVDQFNFDVREGIFEPRVHKDMAHISNMVLRAYQQLPAHVFPEYIACLLVGLYQQSPVIIIGVHHKKFTEAHLLLDDGYTLIKKAIDLLRDASDDEGLAHDHSRFFFAAFHALKSYLYAKDASPLKALEECRRVLEINLCYPYENESEFKRNYLRNYVHEMMEKAAELKKENLIDGVLDQRVITDNLSLYNPNYNRPVLDGVLAEILRMEGDEFREALKIFDALTKKYPDSSVPLMYWGEALKLYKSEPFNLNPANLDAALEKYKAAEQIDPTWEIIKVKILTVYLFKKAYGQGGEETEEQLKQYLIKAQEFYEHPELRKFLSSLGKSEKKTVRN
jgi:hypothetical protein